MHVTAFKQRDFKALPAFANHLVYRLIISSCLLGFVSLNVSAQALPNYQEDNSGSVSVANSQQTAANQTNRFQAKPEITNSPTAHLQLINLQADGSAMADYSPDSNSTIYSDDDIDAVGDSTVNNNDDDTVFIDDEDESFEDDTSAVAQVSLKAISPETLKTFVAVIDLVRREYFYTVNDEVLFSNAMSGMLTKLDSNAEFLDAEAYENLRAFTQGEVGDVGINAIYQAELGFWVISDVVDDSPADKKGIAVGNYLHQIGEFKLDGERQASGIAQLLTGIAGSQIDVVISKAGRRKQTMTLQRNNRQPQTIETRLVDGIAIIKIPAFQDNSREKIVQNIIDLEAPVAGVLIDVRDNPGGVLTSAVDVASLFMDDIEVVQVKARQGEPSILSTTGLAILKPLPVVILQNRYSASAAEVLASSLQERNRAIVIGETSYGKGSVQSVIPLNDEQAVKLTVAHYLTAAGMEIDKIGVQPDIVLAGNESLWEQQALDLIRQQVRNSGIRIVRKGSIDDVSDTPR